MEPDDLVLWRFAYTPTEVEGLIRFNDGSKIYTMERPWRPGPPGGMPGESCVPDGSYSLVMHRRASGVVVPALRSPDLHVFYTPEERAGRPGRDLIEIHVANWVKQLRGCIAPGLSRGILAGERAVLDSGPAFDKLMNYIAANGISRLVIRPALGTGSSGGSL